MLKTYVVFWSDSFGDWEMKKVFSTEEKAKEFLKDKSSRSWWFVEMDVE